MDDIERQMCEAETMLRAGEEQIKAAGIKLSSLRALADRLYPDTPWPTTPTRRLLAHWRWLAGWLRLVFMIWTHRVVRVMPGLYLQIQRGVSDERVRAALAAYLRNREDRIRKGVLL